ncbi:uncharacterized protein FIESC28_07676 [Fusarium coffeatum]|uniref:Uncharacterized protein n=1 Tax=Fusarium coffeatum TaxID=231269 RepID=A0A366RDR4_9HYPO|nr:uncharacterized protein FIESC28_07676 [Fusarium coffeatum]RBR14440.1 hypothetical protein FIESC28_07676 [Fusarium coffeatum]
MSDQHRNYGLAAHGRDEGRTAEKTERKEEATTTTTL